MSTDITWYYWTNGTQSLKLMNESNTEDANRPFFPNLIPTETLVFSLYLHKFANSLRLTLRAEIFVIINCSRINYCGTYFCDFSPKSQQFDPQNIVLDKSIAKISSTKYGLKANRKNKFRISSKKIHIFE